MADPLDRIADALETNKVLTKINVDVEALKTLLQAHLAGQQGLNERYDRMLESLKKGQQDTRERLITLEQTACQIPPLVERVEKLEKRIAKWAGVGIAVAAIVSAVLNVAVNAAVKILGGG